MKISNLEKRQWDFLRWRIARHNYGNVDRRISVSRHKYSFAYSIPLMLPEVLNQLNQLRRSDQLNQPN